jgi:hypothetical protein
LVGFFGLGGDLADDFIRWWSNDTVQEFHETEKKLARALAVGYAISVFLTVVITATALLKA